MTDPQRERALGAYLQKLRAWNEAGGDPAELEKPARIRVGERAVTIRPWERARIREAFHPDGAAAPEWAPLLAQGVALLTKSLVDVEQLRRDPHLPLDALYRLQADLMLDTAIGMALLRETQDVIDGLVFSGEVEQAKQLSEFRHKLARTVSEIKRLLSATELERAEKISGGPVPATARGSSDAGSAEALKRLAGALEAAEPSPTGWSAIRKRRPRLSTAVVLPVRVPNRTEIFGVLLFLTLAAWVVFVRVPAEMVEKPKLLTRLAASRPELFESFEPRPPSLFVTLAPGAWDSLSSPDRRELLKNLAAVAKDHGYLGVLVRTPAGKPVGHWLKVSGFDEIEQGEEPPPPPEEVMGPTAWDQDPP